MHPRHYLAGLAAASAAGGGRVEADTVLNAASWDAVLGATGAVVAAVDHALAGRGNAFAAVRPPGHHALREQPMGFCLVGNAVIAADEARARGIERVLIIDWDVHHGNGTQALVEQEPAIRYVSLHQWPWYPGTGTTAERGVGNIFNVPRGPGLAPMRYVDDLWEAVLSATTDWTPGLIIISAGFDAMAGDPLGGFTLEPEHYATLTTRIREHLPAVPVVSLLEGGYAPNRLAEGAAAHLTALA